MDIISIVSGLGGAIVGGLFTLLATYLTLNMQHKKDKELQELRFLEEDKKWLREKRLELFTELVDVLESYQVPMKIEFGNYEYGYADSDKIKECIDSTKKYFDDNKGKLSLFLPSKINSRIVKLRGDLYNIFSSSELQKIPFNDFENSEIFRVVTDADEIILDLKKELGIYEMEEK